MARLALLRIRTWRPEPSISRSLDALAIDLRHAIRGLSRSRVYTAAAVLTLALGVGANAAVFSATWHLLLKPLPWPHADRLIHIWNTTRATGTVNVLAPANYLDIAAESTRLESIAAYTFFNYSLNLTGAGEPVEVHLRAVTADYFRVMGAAPLIGRTLMADDVVSDAAVIVIGEGLWQRQFGGRADVVGTRIHLDGRPYEVVGVMASWFEPSSAPIDGWLPYVMTPELSARRQGFFLGAVARLGPGVTVNEARAEIDAIAARAAVRHPETNQRIGATARSLREELVGTLNDSLFLVVACATLVLLIAAVNLAGLQAVRARGLVRDAAVRAAVGATRGRLLRLALLESGIIGVTAGVTGLFAGAWTIGVLASLAPPTLRVPSAVTLDPVVAVATLIASVASALIVGLIATWGPSRGISPQALRSRSATDHPRLRWTVITPQVALATSLLVIALTVVVSLVRVLRVELGFDPAQLVAFDLRLPPSRYPTPALQTGFFDRVLEQLAGDPRVEAVCATNTIPFEQAGNMTYVPDGTERLIGALPVTVSPSCFAALHVPLVDGRLFASHEREPVAIVSRGYAARAWPGEAAVGRMIRIGLPSGEPLRVIGVVGDSRRVSLEHDPYAQVYQPAQQARFFVPTRVLIRSAAPSEAIAGAVRAAVRAIDSDQPVGRIRVVQDLVTRSAGTRRLTAWLLGGFASIAGLLAGVGIYSLLAQHVARRRSEIGVRVALGAQRRALVRLITAQAVAPVAAGVACGLGGAWLASTAVAPIVVGVSATDPVLYASAASALIVLSILAALIPIRRATRVDPVAVLREG